MRSDIKIERLENFSGTTGSVFKLKDRSGTRYIWVEHKMGYREENGVKTKVVETVYNFRSPDTMYIDVQFPSDPKGSSTYLPVPGPLYEDDYKALSAWLSTIKRTRIIPATTTKPRPTPQLHRAPKGLVL